MIAEARWPIIFADATSGVRCSMATVTRAFVSGSSKRSWWWAEVGVEPTLVPAAAVVPAAGSAPTAA